MHTVFKPNTNIAISRRPLKFVFLITCIIASANGDVKKFDIKFQFLMFKHPGAIAPHFFLRYATKRA